MSIETVLAVHTTAESSVDCTVIKYVFLIMSLILNINFTSYIG